MYSEWYGEYGIWMLMLGGKGLMQNPNARACLQANKQTMLRGAMSGNRPLVTCLVETLE